MLNAKRRSAGTSVSLAMKKSWLSTAHELRNEAVEELTPDLVGESRAELDIELMRDGRNRGMEGEKGRR
jgi:hypothetical protein